MADQLLSARTPDTTTPVNHAIAPTEKRHRLARIVAEKVEQGYRIESHSDSEAVVVTRGRRRWLGLGGHEPGTRHRLSIDEQGIVKKRKC
jgi:hypothetical protein